MTPEEWNTCTDPRPMLEFLRGKASDRKLRLFAVACCRRIWRHLDNSCLEAVTTAERFADGVDSSQEVEKGLEAAWLSALQGQFKASSWAVIMACAWARLDLHKVAWGASRASAGAVSGDEIDRMTAGHDAYVAWDIALAEAEEPESQTRNWESFSCSGKRIYNDNRTIVETKGHAALLRCLFGPYSLRAIILDFSWLTPNVVSLAQAIYTERAFDRMPILADALEESGCNDTTILGHCRSGAEHVRGCWVVDLVLGKE